MQMFFDIVHKPMIRVIHINVQSWEKISHYRRFACKWTVLSLTLPSKSTG